ncbi:MAG: MBL fold metallo-hydrolase [Bacteroidales bacterium]|jgi:phosphoribosyl 1,2-cyclic phosphate phosphodiesterase|nr:MBL fold metallo-hydrolase [Bacteroidales bacterium]
MFQLVFLGTGTSQGVPVIACPCGVCRSDDQRDKRLRSSVLIRIRDLNIVIDSGPDFRRQMLRADVRKLDAILFTHGHKDHTAGLDDVRAYNYALCRPMDVYAEKRVQHTLKREFAYAFAEEKYPGIPEINMHTISVAPFLINGEIPVIPIRAMHLKLPVLGFRIGKMAYLTDTNKIAETEKKKLLGLDCFVVNGLRKEPHISHFSLQEAIDLIEEVKPARAFITHISHQMGFHRQVQDTLPPHIRLAYDGLELTVNDR